MTHLTVRERRESVTTAKSCLITCLGCGKMGVVTFITNASLHEKQAAVRQAAGEHRRIGCTAAHSA